MTRTCYFLDFHPDLYASQIYVFLTAVHVLSGIVSTALNALVIRIIWKVPSLHKASMLLIAGLSLKDLCMGALVEPLYTTWLITAQKAESFELFCVIGMIAKSLLYLLTTLAGFNLTGISVDRCFAVRSKANYRSLVTIKRVTRFLILAWILSFVIDIPLNFTSRTNTFRGIAALGVMFFLVSKTCYILSILALRKLQNQVSQTPTSSDTTAEKDSFDISKYRRSLITLLIVICCDVLFYCPLILIAIVRGLEIKMSNKNWNLYLSVCEILMLLPSFVNPCIFLWRMKDLQKEAKKIIKSLLKRGQT